ncbi:hypothetical protein HDA35_004817 [Micromonospora purpureochromogenes]|uniref:Uncharacterized protein n=1 Tax=Micromonospora purpureochromogenes TaxID=47872 RepID=A0ABX2RRI1_9ACTN|nr:hypothetical protein [Micromonospora purpureochromogenes]
MGAGLHPARGLPALLLPAGSPSTAGA